jgi:hypothetical protein
MKFSACIPAVFLLASFPATAQQSARFAPEPYAQVSSAPLTEMSGIVKSKRRDNLYWVHNDSGDSPRIFAITAEGASVLPTYSKFSYYGDAEEEGKEQWQGFEVLYANNVDWEDIAIDDNYLYLADIGNNANRRRDLAIYMVSEIDPTASTRTAVIKKLHVVYPEQTEYPPDDLHYDSESLFVFGGKLYLITKHRASAGIFSQSWEAGANLYRLDTAFDDRPNVLTRVDSHPDITAATSADLSPDGQTLAVLSPTDIYLFRHPTDDHWFSQSEVRRVPISPRAFKQAEGIAWESDDGLLITNEQGDIFRVPVSALPGSWGG